MVWFHANISRLGTLLLLQSRDWSWDQIRSMWRGRTLSYPVLKRPLKFCSSLNNLNVCEHLQTIQPFYQKAVPWMLWMISAAYLYSTIVKIRAYSWQFLIIAVLKFRLFLFFNWRRLTFARFRCAIPTETSLVEWQMKTFRRKLEICDVIFRINLTSKGGC